MFHDDDTITLQLGDGKGPYLVWNQDTVNPGVTLATLLTDQWVVSKVYGSDGLFVGFTFASVGAQKAGLANCYLNGVTQTGRVGLSPSNTGNYSGTFWAGVGVSAPVKSDLNGSVALVCLGKLHGFRILHGAAPSATVRLAEAARGQQERSVWCYSVTQRPIRRSDLNVSACSVVYDPGNNLVFSSASVQVTNSGKVGVASGYVSADCYLTASATDLATAVSIGDFPLLVPNLAPGAQFSYVLDGPARFNMARFLAGNPAIASGMLGEKCYVFIQARQEESVGPSVGAGSFSADFVYKGTT